MHFAHSDHTPFAFERDFRSPRPTDRRAIVVDEGAAHRLMRSTGRAAEPTLSSLAERWRDQFAADARPRNLCTLYPRVANRLALCWSDKALTATLFKDLLVDRRGGRKGFPAPVQAELLLLAAVNAGRPAAAVAGGVPWAGPRS